MKRSGNIPLSVPVINGNEWKYVKECIDTAWVSTAGKFVDKFENDICRCTGARYAVACVNGTTGLFIALRLAGVAMDDEVIVPTLTFIASVNAIKYLGAEPVFMDCDDYMNIDAQKVEEFILHECRPTKNGLKNKVSGRIIKAILPVHIFGNPCNMSAIMRIAKKYDLKVIEDATESLGASYKEGGYANRFTGTIADFGVLSFNGNKIITTGGGGMIITANAALAEKARYLTTQAKDDAVHYIHNEIGYNFRLTNVQAALGVAQLEQLPRIIKIKQKNYELYKKELKSVKGIEILGIPRGTNPNYWFYSLIVNKNDYGMDREQLMKKLKGAGIESRPLWYLNHWQKPYVRNQAYKIEKSVWFWEHVLNIPCSGDLSAAQVKKVALHIKMFQG